MVFQIRNYRYYKLIRNRERPKKNHVYGGRFIMSEFNIPTFERVLGEKNFLAGYLMVKDAAISRQESWEYTGKIVTAIIEEMGVPGNRGEKNVYYRSLLLMIFEDIPALSRIYGRQLRLLEESKTSFDLLKNLRSLVDAAKDKDELQARIGDTIENIKETIEDTTQNIQDGTAQKNVEDFFYVAGEGIKEGLKQFSSFLSNINQSNEEVQDRNQESEDSTIKQNPEPVEDPDNSEDKDKGESRD
jgi:hypothetical protein